MTDLTPNQKIKRLNTLLAIKEWSDRDPDLEWYQIGGLHYRPLTGEAHQPKVQVDHATQQRFYAAINRFINADRGYSEAIHLLLDLANIGHRLQGNHPGLYDVLTAELAERKAAR